MLGISGAQATIIYVMVNLMRYLKPIVASVGLAMGILQPVVVSAQSDTVVAPSMDELLQQLSDAEPGQAAMLADRIQREWDKSGSASADFLLKRGRDAMERDEPEVAIEHFTALVDHAPDFAQGWAERARAFFVVELYGPAVGDLEHALALEPRHFEAMMGLAVILDTMNRPKDAYEAYLQVKAIHPNQPGLTEALQRLEPLVRGQEL